MPIPRFSGGRSLQVDTSSARPQPGNRQNQQSSAPASRKNTRSPPKFSRGSSSPTKKRVNDSPTAMKQKKYGNGGGGPPSPTKIKKPESPGFMKTTAATKHRDVHQNSPRTVPSMDESTASTSSERDVVLEKLRASLSRFTRSGNRRMMLRTLKDNKSLSSIPVQDINANFYNPESDYEWKELEIAVGNTVPVSLNGMLIGTDALAHPESTHREGKKFLQLLRLLCNRLAVGLVSNKQNKMSATDLYQHIIQRLAREPSELTAIDHIRPLLETAELTLETPMYKKTNTAVQPVPTSLTLYVTDGYAHCTVQHVHHLGLFRKQDPPSRPFCSLTVKVHERVNLTTGSGVKQVGVSVLEDKLFALYG